MLTDFADSHWFPTNFWLHGQISNTPNDIYDSSNVRTNSKFHRHCWFENSKFVRCVYACEWLCVFVRRLVGAHVHVCIWVSMYFSKFWTALRCNEVLFVVCRRLFIDSFILTSSKCQKLNTESLFVASGKISTHSFFCCFSFTNKIDIRKIRKCLCRIW